jgi:hypothetical protein
MGDIVPDAPFAVRLGRPCGLEVLGKTSELGKAAIRESDTARMVTRRVHVVMPLDVSLFGEPPSTLDVCHQNTTLQRSDLQVLRRKRES